MRSRTRALIAAGFAVVAIAVVVVASLAVFGHPQPSRSGRGLSQAPLSTSSPAPIGTDVPRPAPTDIGDYVALGDSYAAGVGGGSEAGSCEVSPFSYPSMLDGEAGIVLTNNAACSAATTTDVVAGQIGALSSQTRLVTLSIGGNDLNVQALARDCTGSRSGDCDTDFASALASMKTLPANLRATYRAVAGAAPHATIIVTGYPTLFASPKSNSVDLTSTTLLNAETEELDMVIARAVATEHHAGLKISFVSVDFAAHAIGSATPWIVSSGAHAFHPNAAGYRAYAQAILNAL